MTALQTREEPISIADIDRRHFRAGVKLGDWQGADADLAPLRRMSPNDAEIDKLKAWAHEKRAQRRAISLCAASLQPFAATPWSIATAIGPQTGYFAE